MHQCTVCNTVGLQVPVVALCLQIHKNDIFYSSEERVTTHLSLSFRVHLQCAAHWFLSFEVENLMFF